MDAEETPPRGLTDRRARLLIVNAAVVGGVDAMLLLLLVSYRALAPSLGLYGWTLASIVAGLAGVSALCILAAYRVQVVVDRAREAADAVAAGWSSGPVDPDPDPVPPAPPAPAVVPVRPTPVRPAPAAARPVPSGDQARIDLAAAPETAPEPAPQPAAQPAEVTEPAHH